MSFYRETDTASRPDGWNVAGTAGYDSANGFASRVLSFNKRKASAAKRALFADTKANRKAYGTPSANFKFTPRASDATDLPPWLAAWPVAVLDSVAA